MGCSLIVCRCTSPLLPEAILVAGDVCLYLVQMNSFIKRPYYAIFLGNCKGCFLSVPKILSGIGAGGKKSKGAVVIRNFKSVLGAALELILPSCCVECGQAANLPLCPSCLTQKKPVEKPLCYRCGLEVHGEKEMVPLCSRCMQEPPPFSQARSILRYDEGSAPLISRLKYGTDTSMLRGIGLVVDGYDFSVFDECHFIVPVPLHPNRLRARGFNQAVLLAELFFQRRKSDIRRNWLLRSQNTIPQSGLDGIARRKNLRKCFALNKRHRFKGASVCLVDDVYTTGTTVTECSRALLAGGTADVQVLTLARVREVYRGKTT